MTFLRFEMYSYAWTGPGTSYDGIAIPEGTLAFVLDTFEWYSDEGEPHDAYAIILPNGIVAWTVRFKEHKTVFQIVEK